MNEPICHIRYRAGLAVPIISILLLCFSMVAHGQPAVKITDSVDQHMFTSNEIQYLEDKEGKYNIKDVLNPEIAGQFVAGRTNTPQNYNLKSAYWYRIKIRHQPSSHKNWILDC